jgi:hypothetical protein
LGNCRYFTLLSGNSGIKSKDEKKQGITISPSEHLEHHEIRKRFGNWLVQKGWQDWYHIFFSYRWNPFDEDLTMGVYHQMGFEVIDGTDPPLCFLDKMRLEIGGNFIEDFSSSLIMSQIAVVFCVQLCS